MDIIFLEEFKLDTLVGVYPWEKLAAQTIELNLQFGIPSSTPCQSDDLADTIDYGAVVERIRTSLAAQHFTLLEALAEHVAQILLQEFGAPWVKVSVAKLGLIRGVKKLGVVIERRQ